MQRVLLVEKEEKARIKQVKEMEKDPVPHS